jgi:hypothetical protein
MVQSLPWSAATPPQGAPKIWVESFPQKALKTRAGSGAWTWDANGLPGGSIYASRLHPPCISLQHGDPCGVPDGRRYEHRKHGGGAAHASPWWRERSPQQSPAGRRKQQPARQDDTFGTALGIALGFSFQVRHRPINPSVARPARMRAPWLCDPVSRRVCLFGTIPPKN